MKKERRAGTKSSTHGVERDSDPEFKSHAKNFRYTGFVGSLNIFSLGPKHTFNDLEYRAVAT